jgi:isoleucyl-tRNA synthetase
LYKTLSITEKRNKCKDFANENVNKQIEQFKRLGLIFDLKNNYLTMYPWFEYNQLNLFLSMVEKHLIFQDFKPVW